MRTFILLVLRVARAAWLYAGARVIDQQIRVIDPTRRSPHALMKFSASGRSGRMRVDYAHASSEAV
jgi:hypothetical protein